MDSLKSIIFTIFVVVLLGFSGYWAFTTLESGSSHVDVQKLKELENQNKELTKEVTDLNRQISLLEADKAQANTNPVQDTSDTSQNPNTAVVTTQTITTNPAPVKTTTNTKPIVNKNQSLIDDLQKLANSKIFLKLKSQGPEVGTIQKFLNIYNNTSNKIDNDFGVTTQTAIKKFQKAVGLTADGAVGSSTILKMISWLKSH